MLKLIRVHNPGLLVLALFRLLGLVLMTLCLLPLVAFSRLVSQSLPHRLARLWARLVLVIIGLKAIPSGELPPSEEPLVIVSNHLAYLDIPLVLAKLPLDYRFIADRGVFRVPLMGQAMRLAGYLPISSSRPSLIRKTIARGLDYLKNGVSVIIFPEGGINRSGEPAGFERVRFGFQRLASGARVRILQLSLAGTDQAQREFCRLRKRAVIHYHSELIDLEDFRDKTQVVELIQRRAQEVWPRLAKLL